VLRNVSRLVGYLVLCACCCGALELRAARAARPTESLLPNTTKGFLSVANVDVLKADWEKTQLGQLMNDPLMKPFVDDFHAQIKKKWLSTHEDLGLSLEELDGVPGGELAFAMLQPAAGKYAVVILVDATGHDAQAKALLTKVTTNLAGMKGVKIPSKVSEITAFNLPKHEHDSLEKRNRQAAFFYKNNWLAFCDSVSDLEAIYGRLNAPAKDSLDQLESFHYVMTRCAAGSDGLAPEARWFIEPFGYVEAQRAANPPRAKVKNQADMLKILKAQGFDCVQGIGGYVNFMVNISQGKYDILHHSAIYAPPVKGKDGQEKYNLAARMLKFPNATEYTPQAWVPRELAAYTSFHMDIQNAFKRVDTLVDAIVGERGSFQDVIDSMRDDPNGPQIDIERDLIGNLGSRITILSDYELPITTKSERMLVAIDIAKNPQDVAELIRKAIQNDKYNKILFENNTIWEIVKEEDKKGQEVSIEIPGEEPVNAPKKNKDNDDEKGGLPNMAMCVAYGQLFVGTHVDIVKKVLHQAGLGKSGEATSLAQSVDYRLVSTELTKLGGTEACAKSFSRTDEECRTTYELIRMGKMPQAETMLGKLLNALLTEKEGEIRRQRIDGHNLPEFDVARRYFGPAGIFITTEKEGWWLTGFMLTKDAPAAEVANAPKN
jgi:hypothetical protein